MKKLIVILFLMTALLPMVASADPVEIDGIWYHLNPEEKTAEVTYGDWPTNYYISDDYEGRYSGDIEIPASVVYESTEYNVTCIGESAFTYCLLLNSITIPNSVTSIGKDAFKNSYDMKSVHISDLEAWCKISFSTEYSNPVCYAHRLYLNGVEVKDVVIPESLTSIGNYTFYNCYNLTSVIIPNSVTSIGDGAFHMCSLLTSFTIPDHVTSIGASAFHGCGGLTSINIPNGVKTIGEYAFAYCRGLTSITIPNGVTDIEEAAFLYCDALTSVTIPNSVRSIGKDAFAWCSGLTSITIPNGVTTIGFRAFGYCNNLTSITIPSSVTSIGNSAFRNCSKLASVTISNGVTSIEESAFTECSALTSVTIPNSVKSIGNGAFAGCKSLTSLTLPNSIMNISFKMFWECSGLNSIIIPGSVTSIEQSAFYGCSGLSDVYCYADMVPSTDYFVFDDSTPEHATLHVPAASVSAYQAVEPWKNFKEIVALTGSDLMSIGIITIESLTNGKSVIYDMNGRRHSGQPTKGLYIHNGKKVVVK